jgi:ribosomal protein L9
MTTTRASHVISAWLWTLVILATATLTIEPVEAWTTSPTSGLFHRFGARNTAIPTTVGVASPTCLFGKKKKKMGGGGSSKSATKIQVKLLQHIAGTGQAGEVVLVNPIFFDNKLRPQKLARVITDEEVQQDLEKKQSQSDELLKQASAVKELIDDGEASSSYVLAFRDNQTGPDGKKLFGGIGPKKLLESLRKDCKEFEAFSKTFTKQVSILGVDEQETVESAPGDDGATESKYKDYSSHSSSKIEQPPEVTLKYTPLPKKDKLIIKHTGVFRMKVALTKDLFAKVKVIVE